MQVLKNLSHHKCDRFFNAIRSNRIFVKVKARAKQGFVKKIDEFHFIVSVKEPPVDGKANLAVLKSLADYLNLKRSDISLIAGHTSNQKVFEISGQH